MRPFFRFLATFFTTCFLLAGSVLHADDAAALTYTKNIAPIFQKHCQSCHHNGTNAPMSLMKFQEVRPWVKSIRDVVVNRTMPPWHADPAVGKFKNDRSLPKEDHDTILAWIAQGNPAGDPKDHPPAITFDNKWQIGEPDMIFKMPEFKLDPNLTDDFMTYRIPTGFTEDKWLEAVELRPGNPSVTHHIDALPPGGFYIPGIQPVNLEPGYGILAPANIVFKGNVHYHKDPGVGASDQSMIGVRFARQPVTKRVYYTTIECSHDLRIPPNTDNYPTTGSIMVDNDSQLLGLMPHMHYRGKSIKVTATYPDGRQEALLSVPKYDFTWQTKYDLVTPVKLPKGTKLEFLALFDNSANNPKNPDPTKTVPWGGDSTDEMGLVGVWTTCDTENIAEGKFCHEFWKNEMTGQ